MNAIILCGGLSTRLGDITKNMPKVLLEIKGKTVLDWQLEKLKKIGIKEVVMAAGHLSELILEKVGESRNGVFLNYAIEKERLGTGGAVKHAMEKTDDSLPTIVLNGDVLTTVSLEDMTGFLNPESDGVLLGTKVDDASSYGTLEFDENFKLTAFKEKEGFKKPGYINGGFYILNPSIKKYFPKQSSFSIEYDVFPFVNNFYVYKSEKPWIDIGLPQRLDWARNNWKE